MQLKGLFLALMCSCLFACGTTPQKQLSDNVNTAEQKQPQRFILNDGLQVSLLPPTGFNLTAEHYGFVQPESFSRIKVFEVEVPYQEYVSRLHTENLSVNKLQLVDQKNITVNNAVCNLLALKMIIAGTVFDKQLLICGDDLSSVVVEASYPESANNNHKQAIFSSMTSLNVNAENALRLFTGLPFKLTSTPEYKITKRFRNSVVLQPLSDESGKSSVVISYGTSEDATLGQLAELLISKGVAPEDLEILSNEQAKLETIPALATTAYINIAGESYWTKQILSYQNNRFLLVQARAPKVDKVATNEKLENLLSHFKFK